MSYNVKIFDFPELKIRSQLFYAGGAAFEGGFTSGGAEFTSPEPGGRAFLEMQLALQVNEWDLPYTSWLTSKINNGSIFRIRLTETPQLVRASKLLINSDGQPWSNNQPWLNDQNWFANYLINVVISNYEGQTLLSVSREQEKDLVKLGHVIGIGDSSYIVENIRRYDGITEFEINPPLRRDITTQDRILLRPFFLGKVTNPTEFRTTYESSNNGHIAPGRLVFSEFIP